MQIAFKRILWPTDFSEHAQSGGRVARELAAKFASQLHIIHVLPPPFAPTGGAMAPAELPVVFADANLVDSSRQSLHKLIAEDFAGDAAIRYDAFIGNPWVSICDYAEREKIELIVIATHGWTGLKHALIGSTAERIVRHAKCPVLVVK
jgi:universal stress protein A